MRILVACRQCKRRYRAAERKVGTKFRCHCGEVLLVRQPEGHASSIVRCSSCGGHREGDSRACGFCGADFTLHERDLNTVCPNCFARVSDRARYCSECGDRLSAESIAGEDSKFTCPVCPSDERLASRRLGKENINVLECQYCAGLWIGVDAFHDLRDRVAGNSVDPAQLLLGQPKPHTLRRQAGPMYRTCVQCRRLMSRRQYAKRSGVIIDVCRDHGIWFDPEELHQVLRWTAEGGRTERPIGSVPGRPKARESLQPIRVDSRGETAENDFLDDILSELLNLGW